MTWYSQLVRASRKGLLCILMGLREHAELLQKLLASLVQLSVHTWQEALAASPSLVQEGPGSQVSCDQSDSRWRFSKQCKGIGLPISCKLEWKGYNELTVVGTTTQRGETLPGKIPHTSSTNPQSCQGTGALCPLRSVPSGMLSTSQEWDQKKCNHV